MAGSRAETQTRNPQGGEAQKTYKQILDECGGDPRSAQAEFAAQQRRVERQNVVRYPDTPRTGTR